MRRDVLLVDKNRLNWFKCHLAHLKLQWILVDNWGHYLLGSKRLHQDSWGPKSTSLYDECSLLDNGRGCDAGLSLRFEIQKIYTIVKDKYVELSQICLIKVRAKLNIIAALSYIEIPKRTLCYKAKKMEWI